MRTRCASTQPPIRSENFFPASQGAGKLILYQNLTLQQRMGRNVPALHLVKAHGLVQRDGGGVIHLH